MHQRSLRLGDRIRSVVAMVTAFAMALGIAAPALAADTATFTGAVLNPENAVAPGCTVVFKDVATGQEFKSAPTGPNGEYSVSVPVGGRYKLDSVIAPDGTKLPVQNVPPMPVRVAGSTRLDVKFASVTAAGSAAPAAAAGAAAAGAGAAAGGSTTASSTAPPQDQKKKDKSGVPWWKRPGPIVGMVLGGVALVALIASAGGGGSDNNASPSTPAP